MFEAALDPFAYEYMRNAMLGAGTVGALCALLSCFVVLKGWSLLGDALSHAVVPGVAVAAIFGLPLVAGAAVAAVLAVAGIAFVERGTSLKNDAVLGVVFTTFFAAGLLLVSLYPTHLRITTIMFGNLLGIADSDLWQVYGVGLLCLVVIGTMWRDLLAYAFDPLHARSIGLNTRVLHALLLGLLSLACVTALQTVGALLVVAMLIAPGATAYLLTDRFGCMLVIAPLIGGVGAVAGAYASFFLDGAVGGCIVLLQTATFLLAWLFAPKHGLLNRLGFRRPAGAGKRAAARAGA
ncbi:metal ABC transporter permease [Enterovirga rhinocerotis]|uniref:Manganese/iron transport system permease protein n=1 Tax=Enterovirga rhinocerotis TaxID=1339210 RepID=A0A4R7C4F1_9HYPH|nr:metal ABC transporter permease [Enterovirga rhinocerotis]TDR93031.1 manganese/iron transport system permease protein [Enterovirga rhinocerotis]